MGALLALALRLAGLGAGALGVGLPTFALLAGLALGSGPAGYAGYRVGRVFGFGAGYAAASVQAEANRLARDLAEARLDAGNARAAAAAARADASRNAAAAARSRRRLDVYARDLARRGPVGACALSGADAARLRDDVWAVERGTRKPGAPAGR